MGRLLDDGVGEHTLAQLVMRVDILVGILGAASKPASQQSIQQGASRHHTCIHGCRGWEGRTRFSMR